jgi:thiamine pyrophosphokinase
VAGGTVEAVQQQPRGSAALIIAGGEGPETNELATTLPLGTLVIAADSGLDTAARLGIDVDVAIGDFDSASSESVAAAEIAGVELIHHPADKDVTDLELALELAVARSIDDLTVIGAHGGRFDHELANVMLLCSPSWSSIAVTIIDERARSLVVQSWRTLPVSEGALVTLLPIGGEASGVTTSGLAWPLADATLAPGSTRGVSNVAVERMPTVSVTHGSLIAVLPWMSPEATALPSDS